MSPILQKSVESVTSTVTESVLNPTEAQWVNIYCIIGFSVGIFILWNLPYVKHLLLPFKLVTVLLHEWGHASVGFCTGAKIHGIEVNPDEGGITRLSGGNTFLILCAGYLGSAFYGAVMIFCGFNILASQIFGVILGLLLLVVLWFAKNWLTRILSILFAGLVGFLVWWDQGKYIPFFLLFMGVMSSLYSVWDIMDDVVLHKKNGSDAMQLARIVGGSSYLWGVLWLLLSLAFMVGAILLALVVFKDIN